MTREAKLFEAGNYPDKKINITEEDLSLFEENFVPCPVKIEHTDTPFDGIIGTVSSLFRKGKELFGRIDFSKEAWDLIEKAGAKYLSVSINPEEKFISEVSIVQHPRVADARIFSSDLPFEGKNEIRFLREENQKLRKELNTVKADRICQKYFDEGRLLPANIDIAREFFINDNLISFNNENISMADLFEKFLKTLSPQADFSELKKKIKNENQRFTDEQMAFAEKIGVDLGGN